MSGHTRARSPTHAQLAARASSTRTTWADTPWCTRARSRTPVSGASGASRSQGTCIDTFASSTANWSTRSRSRARRSIYPRSETGHWKIVLKNCGNESWTDSRLFELLVKLMRVIWVAFCWGREVKVRRVGQSEGSESVIFLVCTLQILLNCTLLAHENVTTDFLLIYFLVSLGSLFFFPVLLGFL